MKLHLVKSSVAFVLTSSRSFTCRVTAPVWPTLWIKILGFQVRKAVEKTQPLGIDAACSGWAPARASALAWSKVIPVLRVTGRLPAYQQPGLPKMFDFCSFGSGV